VSISRPAFYTLPAGSWRSYVNLLHPPYTAWHLSYVGLGWALTPETHWERLGGTLIAFFLAVGISAHAIDELKGRPLKTGIPAPVLSVLASLSLGGAIAIGIVGIFTITPWLLPFVIVGPILVVAYNGEMLQGRLHNTLWFSLGWGAFPVLTAYFANAETLTPQVFLVAGGAFGITSAQRTLSRWVRLIRREVLEVHGSLTLENSTPRQLEKKDLIRATEASLWLLSLSMPLLAVGLVLAKL